MVIKNSKPKGAVRTDELLERAGISAAQLHEWLKRGLVPGHNCMKAYGGKGIRYWYPSEAVELAAEIKKWRSEGISYPQIRVILRLRELKG